VQTLQTFLMGLVIVVLLTPLLLFYGLPFIAAAKALHAATRRRLTESRRLVLASGIAALGIAPAFDDFLMPKSIYLVLLDGEPVAPAAAFLSFTLTWLVVGVQLRTLAHHTRRGDIAASAGALGSLESPKVNS
jgi:hypothetical protein